ncbi:MAG: hypothetical protein MJA30_36175, partial [Cytophagales bacterium]|nr:hypothetical protein [Cytophagales bacterium]
MATKIRLCKDILTWFMVSIYGGCYAIDVTSPLNTHLEYCQQLFLTPTIVEFHWNVPAAMVCNGLQTIIIFLQQNSTCCILIHSSIY